MRQFRPHCITAPGNCHPLVRFIVEEMQRQRVGYYDLADRSGVDRNTVRAWRTRNTPSVANVEAVLGALGYELRVVRKSGE